MLFPKYITQLGAYCGRALCGHTVRHIYNPEPYVPSTRYDP